MSFENGVRNDYFEWLYNYVCKGRVNNKVSYKRLLGFLHQIEFTFSIPNDVNRAKDGVDLRYRYAISTDDIGLTPNIIMDTLDGPCSVFEMMVALAVRCEVTIMDDTRYGDRTGQWFWTMMTNLGIGYMNDELFNKDIAEEIIYTFLDREYAPDGKGGLFYIRNCEDDLRDIEIWSQLCWYLDKYA